MALLVTLLWSFLPILIKVAVTHFSASFVTTARFVVAFICIFLLLTLQGLRPWEVFRRPPILCLLAGVCLMVNYFTYNIGIGYGSPALAQVLIQSGPLFLVLYGVFFFGEHLRRIQWLGICLTCLGLACFSKDYLANAQLTPEIFWRAFIIILFSGFAWASFAALQRSLSRSMNGQLANTIVFAVGAVVLLPFTAWPTGVALSPTMIALIFGLGINTMIAYMSLAEALLYAPVSQVSLLITMNPLLTLLEMEVLERLGVGGIVPEPVSVLGYVGATLVMLGVIVVVTNKTLQTKENNESEIVVGT